MICGKGRGDFGADVGGGSGVFVDVVTAPVSGLPDFNVVERAGRMRCQAEPWMA